MRYGKQCRVVYPRSKACSAAETAKAGKAFEILQAADA